MFPEYIIPFREYQETDLFQDSEKRRYISHPRSTHWSEGSDQWEIFSDELYGTMSMKMEAPATHSGNEGDKSAENVPIDH